MSSTKSHVVIFKALVFERLREAQILFKAKKYSGAYYLAGYSIELALKSLIISKKIKRNHLPTRKFIESIYKHDIEDLIRIADLDNERKIKSSSNTNFTLNIGIVFKWSEQTRYEIKTKKEAQNLLKAITEQKEGVLNWIQSQW